MAVSGPLPVTEGGTGATTPAIALINLEVPVGTIEAVQGMGGLTGYADSGVALISLAANAPLTGNPTRSTAPPPGDNSNQLATTAWVRTLVTSLVPTPGQGVDGGVWS